MKQPTIPDQIFVQLVDSYLDRVFRYLSNLIRDEDQARELCHETFLRLRKRVDQGFEPGEAYVFTTARNTALSHWRKDKRESHKREAWGKENDNHSDPSTHAENTELREALQKALGFLSEDHRSVFLFSEVEGLKYEQIAQILGISAGTVASRKSNAVRILRGELKRLGHALS